MTIQPLKIYMIAGETSGDRLGAGLIRSLRDREGDRPVHVYGVGGTQMESAGMQSLFPMRELSLMGIAEIVPHLPNLIRRINETARDIMTRNPDMVVTIDSPDFCFRVVKRLRRAGYDAPTFIHYVAPTVWAWRPGRAQKIARLYDGILCLFPFEPPYFTRHGMQAAFIGHPVMEGGLKDVVESADRAVARERLGLPMDARVIGLYFGSRNGEIARMGGIIREVVDRLRAQDTDLCFLVPTLPHLEGAVRGVLDGVEHVTFTDGAKDRDDAMKSVNAALAVSGTVGLELAVANVPHVISYRMNRLTWVLVKTLVRVRFAHLANILLNRAAVPEFIQDNADPAAIARAVTAILYDGFDADEQKASFATMRKLLIDRGGETPSASAAEFIMRLAKENAPAIPGRDPSKFAA